MASKKKKKCGLYSPLLSRNTGLFLLWKLTAINLQNISWKYERSLLGLVCISSRFFIPCGGSAFPQRPCTTLPQCLDCHYSVHSVRVSEGISNSQVPVTDETALCSLLRVKQTSSQILMAMFRM